jgi:hypothetical protein
MSISILAETSSGLGQIHPLRDGSQAGSRLCFVFSDCRQVRPDQSLRTFPDICIAFNLGVGLREDTVIPGILFAVVRAPCVVGPKISDDACASRIGSANLGLAVEKPVRLIEIGGSGYVRGDDSIIVVNRNAIHLHGEQHRDAVLPRSRARLIASEPPQLCP